jgi:two-component sensor histidine kinase
MAGAGTRHAKAGRRHEAAGWLVMAAALGLAVLGRRPTLVGVLSGLALGLCLRSEAGIRSWAADAPPVGPGLPPVRQDGVTPVPASVVDPGERLAEQRQLEAMLREKTVLLDEVHHRVKNNLQVITSLLSLQARGASAEVRAALGACRNRVHAMALTHQLLHEHSDVAQLHVGEYLVQLTRLLADGQRAGTPGVHLRTEGTEAPLHLALPRAIPCGLLVNELVTHAYRHAFPDGRTGTITVGIGVEGDTARLWVEDDGVGLPTDVDTESPTSLGLQLVPLLVEQLGGSLEHGRPPGTRVEVRFPVVAEGRR